MNGRADLLDVGIAGRVRRDAGPIPRLGVQVDEELHSFFNEEAREMSAFLYGRRLYEVMADYWPNAEDDPNATPSMLEFARIWKPGQRSCSRTPSSASTGIAGWFAATRWRRSLDSRPSRDST